MRPSDGVAAPQWHGPGAVVWRARLAVLAAVAGITGYLALRDPQTETGYPTCPSRSLLGLDCPLCGGLRGSHDLLRGRLMEALDHNVLLPVMLGAAGLVLVSWTLPALGHRSLSLRVPRWLPGTAVAVLVAFTVIRNLPFSAVEVLGSGPAG